MAHAAHTTPRSLRARKHEAEKVLRAARLSDLRARTALIASTGAAAVARRMTVEFTHRELQRAAAELAAATEALAAADSHQIPLAAWRRADVAGPGATTRPATAIAAEVADPLFAWGRERGVGS